MKPFWVSKLTKGKSELESDLDGDGDGYGDGLEEWVVR